MTVDEPTLSLLSIIQWLLMNTPSLSWASYNDCWWTHPISREHHRMTVDEPTLSLVSIIQWLSMNPPYLSWASYNDCWWTHPLSRERSTDGLRPQWRNVFEQIESNPDREEYVFLSDIGIWRKMICLMFWTCCRLSDRLVDGRTVAPIADSSTTTSRKDKQSKWSNRASNPFTIQR